MVAMQIILHVTHTLFAAVTNNKWMVEIYILPMLFDLMNKKRKKLATTWNMFIGINVDYGSFTFDYDML